MSTMPSPASQRVSPPPRRAADARAAQCRRGALRRATAPHGRGLFVHGFSEDHRARSSRELTQAASALSTCELHAMTGRARASCFVRERQRRHLREQRDELRLAPHTGLDEDAVKLRADRHDTHAGLAGVLVRGATSHIAPARRASAGVRPNSAEQYCPAGWDSRIARSRRRRTPHAAPSPRHGSARRPSGASARAENRAAAGKRLSAAARCTLG